MSESHEQGVPIYGQSHWCEGRNINGMKCQNIVRNDSDHCEAGHPNEVYPVDVMSMAGASAIQPRPESYGVEDLASQNTAPDWRKVEQMVGFPDYGVAFCVSPWPDGGWMAGAQITDREWITEQAGSGGRIDPAMLSVPGDDDSGHDHAPTWSIFGGFDHGVNAQGKDAAEAIEHLWAKIHGWARIHSADTKGLNAVKTLGWDDETRCDTNLRLRQAHHLSEMY